LLLSPLASPPTRTSLFLIPCLFISPPPPSSTLFPYTTLFHLHPLSTSRPYPTSGFHNFLGVLGAPPPAVSAIPQAHALRHDRRISEEHTSELQSHLNLVCRLLLDIKKYQQHSDILSACHSANL